MRRWLAVGRRQAVPFVVAFAVGLGVVMQFRAQSTNPSLAAGREGANSAQVVAQLVDDNQELRREIDALENRIDLYTSSTGESEVLALVADINRLRMATGLVEVSGPGIQVVINGEITAADAQDLINELWKAGAEAIAIGDQRLVVSRPIQRGDAGLIVNGTQLRSPYVVKALGEADPLASSLDQRGGFASVLRAKYPNIRVTVNRMVDQTLPTYRGTYEFRFARSVD